MIGYAIDFCVDRVAPEKAVHLEPPFHLTISRNTTRGIKMPKGLQGFQKGHKVNVGRSNPHKGEKLPNRSGSNHWNWKGGRHTRTQGYVLVYSPNHPNRNARNQVLEHRLVMEKHLGRYLEPYEVVHHKQGIRDDNRIEELELVVIGKNWHPRTCPKCGFGFLIK